MKRTFSLILASITLALLLTACGEGRDAITGTWIVSGYDCSGEYVSTDDITELYGETSASLNNISIIFTKSGNATLIRPDYTGNTEEVKLSYTVQDTVVEIYNPDEKTDYELLTYNGNEIRIEIANGLTAILEKS